MRISENIQFKPPFILRNGHIQSIMASTGPRRALADKMLANLHSEQLTIKTKAGVALTADFTTSNRIVDRNRKNFLVVLLHGWEGSSKSAYIVTTTYTLLVNGFDVLRLNFRDHGDTHHLNKDIFNSTRIDEVGDAIKTFKFQNNYENVLLGGFSLGGNFALRISADRGEELSIKATLAVCPPIDPNNAMKKMNKSFFIYHYYFITNGKSLQKKLAFFPNPSIEKLLKNNKTLSEMNAAFIPALTEYKSPEEYFKSYELIGDRLCNIKTPTHLIMSLDDPIIPTEDIHQINENPFINKEVHHFGGHCGFIENISGEEVCKLGLLNCSRDYLTVGGLNLSTLD